MILARKIFCFKMNCDIIINKKNNENFVVDERNGIISDKKVYKIYGTFWLPKTKMGTLVLGMKQSIDIFTDIWITKHCCKTNKNIILFSSEFAVVLCFIIDYDSNKNILKEKSFRTKVFMFLKMLKKYEPSDFSLILRILKRERTKTV